MNNKLQKQITKQAAKFKRQTDKRYKTKFVKIRSKVRKAKIILTRKKAIIEELRTAEVNEDLFDLLLIAEFSNEKEYIEAVNIYMRSEMDCYDYKGITLKYELGNMANLMQIITNQHLIIDKTEDLRNYLFGT